MSRAARASKLLALADSDSDELSGLGAKASSGRTSEEQKMPPAKKARGRPPAANKVRKPAQRATKARTNTKIAAVVEKAEYEDDVDASTKIHGNSSKKGRKAAAKYKGDDEDIAETDEEVTSSVKLSVAKPRGRPKAVAAAAAASNTDESKKIQESILKRTSPVAKRGRRPAIKSTTNEDSEIAETQPEDFMDIDTEVDAEFEDLPAPRQPVHRSNRTTESSGVEANEVVLRRRLGETTRKYDNLEAKYRDLRDIGVKAAERNFDILKKESEERAKTANELISHLKADLAVQRDLAKAGQQHQKHLQEMEAKVTALTTSLAEAKQEVKTLSTRLAASRSAEAAASAKVVPGSAVKSGSAAAARAIASSDAVQTGQLREDLYGDLTGLIVRLTKRDPAGQVFDCIQTGRNGTLHFKLEVESESSGEHYEEAHFTYKPQLDSNRDRDLIDMLPDFLVEEITFPRPHAAKFYARVIKSLTERID
ncbi:chromosome segregation protein [Colletotrichum higginsianum]|uniref:Chromosome segregation protein n=2 Tax=Colletotrichum higginsianum TaxID=80884 RepID=H1UZD2_COLHI|nr:Chromosome segregation protein [Colletotrichum higginsianum IMI 349063]OBR12226.1 Chromosome segregation protein [Colletotrichum higginsianum IMI 349063]TIC98956.1 Monopolin complex subunit pcs1 [Colletotrichum higginsianum]CCF33333.1 chromosome segregation protein [Colletotrichum higginsianum]